MSPTQQPRKEHITRVRHGDYWYAAYVFNGSTILLSRLGRVGDCLPG